MKTRKEMEKFKIELMSALKTTDKPYYGLSLENLVLNNQTFEDEFKNKHIVTDTMLRKIEIPTTKLNLCKLRITKTF